MAVQSGLPSSMNACPPFAFFCGIIGHTDKFCEAALNSSLLPEQYPFGPQLRENSRRQNQPLYSPWLIKNATRDLNPQGAAGSTQESMQTSGAIEEETMIEPKRKRGEISANKDAMIMEVPKYWFAAGPGLQPR